MRVVAMPGNDVLATALAARLGLALVPAEIRRFPDRETYLRFTGDLKDDDLAMVCTLDRPDDKFLALDFAVETARELGARSVGLVAPYLAYMRQDKRFHDGEAVTSRLFAGLVSRAFDWMVTVDPHLHRWKALSDIYTIPTRVVHAAPLLARWIREFVADPVLIGPDSESAQWVAAVAGDAGAPHVVLEKTRHGDRSVDISLPDVDQWRGRTPVLVDDIISSGRTMVETVRRLRDVGMSAPVCVAVHGLFADDARRQLREAGASSVVTTNTVPNPDAVIDVSFALADGITDLLAEVHIALGG